MPRVIKFHLQSISLFLLSLAVIACVDTVPLQEEVISSATTTIPTSYVPTLLQQLDDELEESSGLAFFDGKVWTINDSGNENIVYQINLHTGKAERKVKISNAENIDWESLAQSETHLFIGDFGNNAGDRTDLVVLKIKKEDILTKTEVNAEKIFFSYPEQTNFEDRMNSHNFDCEGFFYSEGILHLFTKNWENNQSDYYTLDPNPGNTEAIFQGTFDSEGLITGADINASTGDIVLIGYENKGIFSQSFVWLLSDYPLQRPLDGKSSKILLGSPADLGQTEAIFLTNDNTGFISSEVIKLDNIHITGKLLSFDFNGLF